MTATQPSEQQLAQAKAFYGLADAIAANMIGLLSNVGASPVLAAIVGRNIIISCLSHLAHQDKSRARALVEELAAGLVDFVNELDKEAAE